MNVLATVGAAAVLTALACALFALGASVVGQRRGSAPLLRAGRRAVPAAAIFTTLAAVTLATALLRDDFSLAYVAEVSSRAMLPRMKWAAFYSAQPGSLLLWTWVMSLLMATFVLITVPRIPWGAAHATAACGAVLAAFLFALAFLASPFRASPLPFIDGVGLNPLLVDRGMLVHPPALLGGLASTAIPFVLAVAALTSGRVDAAWLRAARHWSLLAWLVLSLGNFLGAWWAYTVLGWGGYWGWDPVENSALLPLLPLTALLHSAMVQERRGMLGLWSLALALATFALAVFGTFNVRSGLVASVHSFAQSSIGPYFLVLLGVTVVCSVVLLAWRAPRMRAEHDFEALLSRETTLMLNNYVLTAIALVVLGGTLFPVITELVRGTRITVGPPFFNDVVGPLAIVLVALIGVGTLVPWRRAAPTTLARRLRLPLALAALALIALAALGLRDPFALATTGAAIFLALVTLREYALAARWARHATGARWPGAFAGLFERDRRRYGGYLVHLGVAVIAIAVVASHVYQHEARVRVAPGDSFTVASYTFHYDGLLERAGGGNGVQSEVLAALRVEQGGSAVTTLAPGRRFFTNFPTQPTSLVALHTGLKEDLYVFTQAWDEAGVAELNVFVNPLMLWLWVGAAIYIVGGLIAFAPAGAPAVVRRDLPAERGAVQQA